MALKNGPLFFSYMDFFVFSMLWGEIFHRHTCECEFEALC